MIKAIEVCAGYAGLSLGLELAGINIDEIFYSEIDIYPIANLVTKIEQGLLPSGPIWTDLKTFPKPQQMLDILPHWQNTDVDFLLGGFPCQSFSLAGKRKATEDPRHLFPYIKEIINEYRPKTVILENVEGLISAKLKGEWNDPEGTPVLFHVLRELERIDYTCTFGVFSASEVGAPHQRKRVFIMGYDNRRRFKEQCWSSTISENEQRETQSLESELSSCSIWPARPGENQYEWEPPRCIKK